MRVHKVVIPTKIKSFFITSSINKIFSIYKEYGFDIRIVGGAVRDLLLNEAPRDIDFATTAMPHETIYMLNELVKDNYEAVVAKGIMHGTITVAFNEKDVYEITSIAFKITEQNKKLVTSSGDKWSEDAKSRDFTINAMQMTQDGMIYDFVDGYDDLQNQVIKFIGDYKKEIQEYPVLIYRFFKLMSKFPDPQYDENVIRYIQENMDLVDRVKPLTRKWFMKNIQKQKYGDRTIELMNKLKL